MFRSGDILNGCYQIIGQLGSGGIGTIYKANHIRLNREVVVKLLDVKGMGNENARREADILKNLHHTYLPQVFDYVQTEEGDIYTVLDYIPGKDMQAYINEGYTFTTEQLFRWLHQLAEALDYLHNQTPPIIHSDIKPANIMIKPDGDICLIDFNVSLQSGQLLQGLSQGYASPEQYYFANCIREGKQVSLSIIDSRSDIYSLGATFYLAMTRIKPLPEGKGMHRLHEFDIPYPDYLISVIDKCMEISPKKRYQNAKGLIKALDLSGKQDARLVKLRRTRVFVNVFLLFVLAIGIVLLYFGYTSIKIERFDSVYEQYLEDTQGRYGKDIIDITNGLMSDATSRMALNRDLVDYYAIYLNLANGYRDIGKYEKAEEYYEKILMLERGEIYGNYAVSLILVGNDEDAKQWITKALRAKCDTSENRGLAYYANGLLAEKEHDKKTAEREYGKAIISLPDGPFKEYATNYVKKDVDMEE